MLTERYSRTVLLIGQDGLNLLTKSSVAVFGLGGVGSFVVEGLARAGVGGLHLVDFDKVDITNINRQIHALTGTIGRSKSVLMAERVKQINPDIRLSFLVDRYFPGDAHKMVPVTTDYIVDAMDDVAAKVDLIAWSVSSGIPVLSSMGTGNRLDPSSFDIKDISETTVCPLARAVRKGLRRNGITRGIKVLCSEEHPLKPGSNPGSISFLPAVAGLIIAGEVVRHLLKRDANN